MPLIARCQDRRNILPSESYVRGKRTFGYPTLHHLSIPNVSYKPSLRIFQELLRIPHLLRPFLVCIEQLQAGDERQITIRRPRCEVFQCRQVLVEFRYVGPIAIMESWLLVIRFLFTIDAFPAQFVLPSEGHAAIDTSVVFPHP